MSTRQMNMNRNSLIFAFGFAVALFAGEWQVNSAKRYLPDLVFAETARGVVQRV